MAVYYPQGIMTIRVILEDFSYSSDARLQKTYQWTVVCKNLRVALNNYREADTFYATIDYKNFPFDPRIIRSCGVSIFLEDKEQIFDLNQGRRLDLIVPKPENIVFQGFADSDKIRLSDDSRQVILEGRDFTSLLIDREYLGEPINTSKPLDLVLREMLDQLPQTKVDPSQPGQGLLIENQTGETLPTLADLQGSKDSLAGVKNPRKKRSYWDQIQELVADSGLIAYVAVDRLIITKPRNLYDRSKAKMFVYGRNVKNLEYERKLGRQKGFNVRVVSLNVEKKALIEAKIPEEATEAWAKDIGIKREPILLPVQKIGAPSTSQSQATGISQAAPGTQSLPTNIAGGESQAQGEPAPYFVFRVRDVSSKDHLIKIGEKLFEELGRQQIEGRLNTKEMRVANKAGGYFDATKFRIGTPLEVFIDQGDLAGIRQFLPTETAAKDSRSGKQRTPPTLEERQKSIAQFLKARGYIPEVAEALSISLTRFNTPFYTKAIEFRLDQESGFSMDIDFINFIEIPQNFVEQTLNGGA